MYTPPTLPNAMAFAARGHGILLLYGIVDGKCECGTDCGRNAGKHPHHLCTHGLKNATTDSGKIRSWFDRHPNSNYGIVTDTLPTIDVDPRNHGDKTWRELVKKNYDIVGWRVRTGGGGEHIMLGTTTDPGLPSGKLGQGIEFQSVGKYIVGVGSMHASGKRYIWDKSATPRPGETSPQGVPPWVARIVTEGQAKPKQERTPKEDAAFYDMLLEPALPGERRDRVRQLLGHLLGTARPHRGVLTCLVISHVRLTYPDLTDFSEKEIIALAEALGGREDKKLANVCGA